MSIIIKNVSEKKEITILKKYAYGKCGRDYSKIDNYIKSIVLRRKMENLISVLETNL